MHHAHNMTSARGQRAERPASLYAALYADNAPAHESDIDNEPAELELDEIIKRTNGLNG